MLHVIDYFFLFLLQCEQFIEANEERINDWYFETNRKGLQVNLLKNVHI